MGDVGCGCGGCSGCNERQAMKRKRDSKGHFLPAKAGKKGKRKGKRKGKGLAKVAAVRGAGGKSLAARVHRLEVNQGVIVKVVTHLGQRVAHVESKVNQIGSALSARFGGGAARQLGGG